MPIAAAMPGQVADDVRTGAIPRCGHWIAEENPAALLGELSRFLA